MMSDEQIRLSERRHFVDHARALTQDAETRSRSRRDRAESYVERDLSAVVVLLVFVVPGVLLGLWAVGLYRAESPTDVQEILYRYRLILPHSRYDLVEAARDTIMESQVWCVLAALSVLLILAAPVMNLLRRVVR